MQTQGDFKLCASSTDVLKRFAVIKSVIIKRVHCISNKLQILKDFGLKTYEKLFNACVVPILDYHSSVWSYKDYSAIESVQNRSLRYFLGVHRFAPKLAINGDVGWLPAKERQWYNMLRYWNKLINMDNSRICKTVFLSDCSICTNNWCAEVKEIMNKLGFTRKFGNLQFCDIVLVKYFYMACTLETGLGKYSQFLNYEHM